jgi:hypothetical protein
MLCLTAAGVLALGLLASAQGSVTMVPGGYEISYDITLNYLPTNGGNIPAAYVFEWNDAGDFSSSVPFSITGRGRTDFTHIIGFEPTAAIIIGYAPKIVGVGDEKDHLFTFVNESFGNSVIGVKWSGAFPGVPPEPRTGHNAMVGLITTAAGGNAAALGTLESWVQREAGPAAFDPAGDFMAIEWTDGNPDIPEPAAALLAGMGLCLLGWSRRRG